jgi:tetratricopeptide (TPR) repeat protein
MHYMKKFKYLTLFLLVISFKMASAQIDTLSSDSLFNQARAAAFDQQNYPLAISISKRALAEAPDYTDVSIFLGRLYTWSNKTDSARRVFKKLLAQHPKEEDAYLAYGNLEYWNNNLPKALEVVNLGLRYHKQSKDLLTLRAEIRADMKNKKAAKLSTQ